MSGIAIDDGDSDICQTAYDPSSSLNSAAALIGLSAGDVLVSSPECRTSTVLGTERIELADLVLRLNSDKSKRVVFDAISTSLIASIDMLKDYALDVRVDECQDLACTQLCYPVCGGNFSTTAQGLIVLLSCQTH